MATFKEILQRIFPMNREPRWGSKPTKNQFVVPFKKHNINTGTSFAYAAPGIAKYYKPIVSTLEQIQFAKEVVGDHKEPVKYARPFINEIIQPTESEMLLYITNIKLEILMNFDDVSVNSMLDGNRYFVTVNNSYWFYEIRFIKFIDKFKIDFQQKFGGFSLHIIRLSDLKNFIVDKNFTTDTEDLDLIVSIKSGEEISSKAATYTKQHMGRAKIDGSNFTEHKDIINPEFDKAMKSNNISVVETFKNSYIATLGNSHYKPVDYEIIRRLNLRIIEIGMALEIARSQRK